MNKKVVHYSSKNITIDTEISKEYIRIKKEMMRLEKELEPIEGKLKKELREVMRKVDVNKFSSNGLEVSLKHDYIRNSLDTERLKKDDIELYNKYLKSTNIAGSLSINLERGI